MGVSDGAAEVALADAEMVAEAYDEDSLEEPQVGGAKGRR
jgi:hypothetical protein